MEEGKIRHTYFQKAMKTPFVVMERSAMGGKQKWEISSNEMNRRLSNVDHENLEKAELVTVIEQYIQELRNSGYTVTQANEIISSGFRGWKRRIERRERQGQGMYRSAKLTLSERERKKLLERP